MLVSLDLDLGLTNFYHFNFNVIHHFNVLLSRVSIKDLAILKLPAFKIKLIEQITEIFIGVKHINVILMLPELEREVNMK